MDLRKCIIIRKFDTDLYDDEDLELCEEYAVAIEAGEILTEFVTIYRERNFNMCIAVNPDRKRNLKGMEYFKLYNSADPTKATKIARIKFREADYVIHRNNGGKKNWILNSRERRQLEKMLNSPSSDAFSGGSRVWDEMIYHFNNEAGIKALPENLPIPDYVGFLFLIR